MSKVKRILITSLLAFVYCFTFLGGAISNVVHGIYNSLQASATVISENKNDKEDSSLEGYILTVKGISSVAKKGEPINLPYKDGEVKISKHDDGTTDGNSVTNEALNLTQLFVEIKNPFGVTLTKYDEDKGTVVLDGVTEVQGEKEETTEPETEPDTEAENPTSSANPLGEDETPGTTEPSLILTPNLEGIYSVQYFYKVKDDSGNVVWTASKLMQIRVNREGTIF